MNQPLAYLNGEMLPADQARLPINDAGVILGATVTEMVRTFHGRLFRLDDHLDRIARSLKYVGFDIGMSIDELGELCTELVTNNTTTADEDDIELGLVIFVTAGQFPTYAGQVAGTIEVRPTVCCHTFPLPFEMWDDKLERGWHLVTPSIRHVPPQCYDPKVKYRSRMHYYLADREARMVAPDAAALLLDLDGNITETGSANFLVVQDGAVISPTLRNILPGISRKVVIELCGDLGIEFIERDLQLYDVVNADEAFVATTPYCLMSVTRINDSPVGTGQPGPVVDRLFNAWNELVGLDIREQIRDGAHKRRAMVEREVSRQ